MSCDTTSTCAQERLDSLLVLGPSRSKVFKRDTGDDNINGRTSQTGPPLSISSAIFFDNSELEGLSSASVFPRTRFFCVLDTLQDVDTATCFVRLFVETRNLFEGLACLST